MIAHRLSVRMLLVLIGVVIVPPGNLFARRVESWSYERLLRESDLVVIAYPRARADSGECSRIGDWKIDFVGVNTDFEVKAVLKGTFAGPRLRVLHFRLPNGTRVVNGPGLVSFRMKPVELRTRTGGMIGFGKPSYLLFLKKARDGRYEPVSGRMDPVLYVREMHQPLPDKLAEQ